MSVSSADTHPDAVRLQRIRDAGSEWEFWTDELRPEWAVCSDGWAVWSFDGKTLVAEPKEHEKEGGRPLHRMISAPALLALLAMRPNATTRDTA